MNKLSKRLQTVYDQILPCNTLLEIGCDHCWLSIFLVKYGKVKKAIASDINKEPLESCKLNIKQTADLNIETKISDGFLDIEEDFDAVAIAGMGGKLICKILSQRNDLKEKQLILQPQKNEYILRRYLKNHKFNILNEILIEDNGFVYTIISVEKTGKKIKEDIDVYIGPILKRDKSDLHNRKIIKRIKHLEQFVDNIKEENKREEISKEIKILKKFINE